MRGFVGLALCVAVMAAEAQTVQKCVDAKGHVTLTSGSCPTGQRETGRYDATPERETAAQRRRKAELQQWERDQAARRAAASQTYWIPGPRTASENRQQRCAAAKQARDSALAALGLRRTHDQLRYWDDYVYERCK